jgi:DNA-binding NarL/FixJ family response regulator
MKNLRLLIADSDEQILRFISNFLSDDFCIVGTVSDGKALIAAAVALYPHIIIGMPTMTSLDAVRQLESLMPDIKIMVLTDHEEPEVVAAALAAGASTVLIKKRASDLCDKIRAIIRELHTAPPKWPAAVSRSAPPASQGVLQYS